MYPLIINISHTGSGLWTLNEPPPHNIAFRKLLSTKRHDDKSSIFNKRNCNIWPYGMAHMK